MAADLRLVCPEYFDKETDAHFLIADQIDDSQPSRIRERAKEQLPIEISLFPAHSRCMITHMP